MVRRVSHTKQHGCFDGRENSQTKETQDACWRAGSCSEGGHHPCPSGRGALAPKSGHNPMHEHEQGAHLRDGRLAIGTTSVLAEGHCGNARAHAWRARRSCGGDWSTQDTGYVLGASSSEGEWARSPTGESPEAWPESFRSDSLLRAARKRLPSDAQDARKRKWCRIGETIEEEVACMRTRERPMPSEAGHSNEAPTTAGSASTAPLPSRPKGQSYRNVEAWPLRPPAPPAKPRRPSAAAQRAAASPAFASNGRERASKRPKRTS